MSKKLPALTGAEVIRALERAGFVVPAATTSFSTRTVERLSFRYMPARRSGRGL